MDTLRDENMQLRRGGGPGREREYGLLVMQAGAIERLMG
jgi:hypothetical protein